MDKRKIPMIIMLVLVGIMAIGYAAFSTVLNITGTASIDSEWNVLFTNIDEISRKGTVEVKEGSPSFTNTSATFNVELNTPGDNIKYEITIENRGTLPAIVENITASELGSDAIRFAVTGIEKGDKLGVGATDTIEVTISYDENITSQPEDLINELKIDITYVQDTGQTITNEIPSIVPTSVRYRILKDNIVSSDTNVDSSSNADNITGLYSTNKNTENGQTTYYFRGNVTNNYVKFGTIIQGACTYNGMQVAVYDSQSDAPMLPNTSESCPTTANICLGMAYPNIGTTEENCIENYGTWESNAKLTFSTTSVDGIWRIVRINEDGSIRLITENSVIGYVNYNNQNDDNAYVGYMYGTVDSSNYFSTHANVNNSNLKIVLDKWYEDNLKTNYSKYLADAGFCNDRSLSSGLGYGSNVTNYGNYSRLYIVNSYLSLHNPQFACPNESKDLFTTSSSDKGNKALTYPIGTITADEAVYSGWASNSWTSSYLENNTSFWLMTPAHFNYSKASVMYWYSGMAPSYITTDISIGVRPVINLKSDVEIETGNGSRNNPYVIKIN